LQVVDVIRLRQPQQAGDLAALQVGWIERLEKQRVWEGVGIVADEEVLVGDQVLQLLEVRVQCDREAHHHRAVEDKDAGATVVSLDLLGYRAAVGEKDVLEDLVVLFGVVLQVLHVLLLDFLEQLELLIQRDHKRVVDRLSEEEAVVLHELIAQRVVDLRELAFAARGVVDLREDQVMAGLDAFLQLVVDPYEERDHEDLRDGDHEVDRLRVLVELEAALLASGLKCGRGALLLLIDEDDVISVLGAERERAALLATDIVVLLTELDDPEHQLVLRDEELELGLGNGEHQLGDVELRLHDEVELKELEGEEQQHPAQRYEQHREDVVLLDDRDQVGPLVVGEVIERDQVVVEQVLGE